MSEPKGSPEDTVEQPKLKKKAGRPRTVRTKLKKTESVVEIKTLDPKAGRYNEWPTKKAIKINIHDSQEEGTECPFQLGDSPRIIVRRGVDIIVPFDVKSILDDTVVEIPRCILKPNNEPPTYYMERFTHYKYSYFGEVPWQDYIDFLAAERLKK